MTTFYCPAIHALNKDNKRRQVIDVYALNNINLISSNDMGKSMFVGSHVNLIIIVLIVQAVSEIFGTERIKA